MSISLIGAGACKKAPSLEVQKELLIENKVDSILSLMTIQEKIGQMSQIRHFDENAFEDVSEKFIGSIIHTQGPNPGENAKDWQAKFAKFQKKGIKEAPKWHKSKEGRIWHKEHAKKHNFGNYELKTKKCQVCSKEYQSKSLHSKYCSNGCKSKGRLLSGVDNVDRECVGCGATFSTNKYKKTKTCSRSCASLISR